MADFALTSAINVYIGASTDTKPASCKNGSRCYEHDTKTWYITYDNGSHWVSMQDLDAIVLGAGTALVGKVGIDQATANANEVVVKSITAGTNVIGKTGHDITGITNNRKVVTTAGTAVALAASTAAKYVVITAETDNTGVIVVGGSGVVAALATRQGTPLNPGASMGVPIDNLADVYIDSTVSGDGVTFTYLT